MKVRGRVWKYGKNIDTDLIIPARYLNTSDPKELAKHALEDLDHEFATKVKQGDIIVADDNFGCGSSREHAPLALKGAGVSLVIATSFARIFYRNAFNIGLPIMESPEAAAALKKDDEVEVSFEDGSIRDLNTKEVYHATPIPPFMQEIVNSGGLINYVKTKKSAGEKHD